MAKLYRIAGAGYRWFMWSSTRKHLEERLAECLQGRVRYHVTRYPTTADCHRCWITLDGVEAITFRDCVNCFAYCEAQRKRLPHVDVVAGSGDSVYTLSACLSRPFDALVASSHQVEQIFAVLDRRMGVRRLRRLDFESMPDAVFVAARFRVNAEGLHLPIPAREVALPVQIEHAMLECSPALLAHAG